MSILTVQSKHRLTQREKYANDKQWYKEQANLLDTISLSNGNLMGYGAISDYKRKKTNYDLFNNIINISDFAYVCQPFGAEVGELPANFTNRDIVSGKIKVLLGMEMEMPFDWNVVATNEEAVSRKLETEYGKIRDFVVGSVMKPIRTKIEQKYQQQQKGRQLTPEEAQDIQSQIEQEVQSNTPDIVRQFMTREHKDPLESLMTELLNYAISTKNIEHKFNKGWKHANLSGDEVYWVGETNGEPDIRVVNSLRFDHSKSPDTDFIEDGEWAVQEMRMTPSEVIANFGAHLTEEEIDRIYSYADDPTRVADADFTFNTESPDENYTVRVLHCNFKALRLVQFLTYMDESGKPQEMIVDENYKLNKEHGDIKLEKEWIPESHEVYKIMNDIYVLARPVPGQEKDLDNLWDCKLSYYGASIDSLNSPVTAPMDRMKTYQYFYNVILYRIELLLASDKGKVLAGNINGIPKSAGIDLNKWMYFLEANKIAWANPNEEGNKMQNGDIGSMFKEIDMSLVSNIEHYMNLAESIDRKCGASIGVTPQMEAQISSADAVSNTRQNLVQASYIIRPHFELHNKVKENVLQGYINAAISIYSQKEEKTKLSYILDDMSQRMLTLDPKLLQGARVGMYVANSGKAARAKQMVESLAQAAMQNQQVDLIDVLKVVKSSSLNQAEELLEAAQDKKQVQMQAADAAKAKAEKDAQIAASQQQDKQWAHEKDMVIIKEQERRKTEIQKEAMAAMGYDPNKDEDDDGQVDVMEVAKHGLNADIQKAKLDLDNRKFQHQQVIDKGKLANEEERNKIMKQKTTQINKG